MAERERKGREKIRAKVRMSQEEWDAVKWAVGWRGDPSVSHIIRAFLRNYVRDAQAGARLQEARRRAAKQRSELDERRKTGGSEGSPAG